MKPDESMEFLVVVETHKVKSFLFASPFMRETRGASLLLDRLNRIKVRDVLKNYSPNDYEKIYLGGGSGRVLFRNERDAEKFKEQVVRLYQGEAGGARISVEIIKRRAGGNESFPEWMSRGVSESQKRKLSRAEGVPILAGRWIQPCTSCGSEPAEYSRYEFGKHLLCKTCAIKREEVNELYDKTKPIRAGALKSESNLTKKYTKKFIFSTLAHYTEEKGVDLYLPQDFQDIGDKSRPANYMGFIYADGDRMGQTVKRIGTLFQEDKNAKLAYTAFSEIVDQATREAAVEAVLENVGLAQMNAGNDHSFFLPAEFIMAGGDDLMLVVPAHQVLDVAADYIEKFKAKTKKMQAQKFNFAPHGLTASAGVVIAHAHYPVSDLMSIAADLMKIAKKKAARLADRFEHSKDSGEITGAIDFMVISDSGTEPVKERREAEYSAKMADIDIKLTERPYTAAELRRFIDTVRSLKSDNVPRSKLKALYATLFRSPMQAQFDALRIKERLQKTGDLAQGSTLFDFFQGLRMFPYRESAPNKWTTPLSEVIEFFDFI